jgi:hypothetical protein
MSLPSTEQTNRMRVNLSDPSKNGLPNAMLKLNVARPRGANPAWIPWKRTAARTGLMPMTVTMTTLTPKIFMPPHRKGHRTANISIHQPQPPHQHKDQNEHPSKTILEIRMRCSTGSKRIQQLHRGRTRPRTRQTNLNQ